MGPWSSGSASGIVSRSTTNIQPSGRLTIMHATAGIDCGPQDSNLQPRDSRALAFPRGLDYLILLFTNAAAGFQSISSVRRAV